MPPQPPTAAKPGLSSEQTVTGMVLVRVIILVTVNVLWELSRRIAQLLPSHTDETDGDDTMTLMCFLHAGIPSVTVARATALMLFCPKYRMFFAYIASRLVWLDVLS